MIRKLSLVDIPIVLLLASLAGCSGDPEKIELRPEGNDPPEVVRALSIGGRLDAAADGEDKSVACAAALRLTAQKVGAMAAATGPDGENVAERASNLFVERAVQAGSEGATRASVERSIDRLMIEKRDDVRGQAQLSIACLRSLQSEAGRAPAA